MLLLRRMPMTRCGNESAATATAFFRHHSNDDDDVAATAAFILEQDKNMPPQAATLVAATAMRGNRSNRAEFTAPGGSCRRGLSLLCLVFMLLLIANSANGAHTRRERKAEIDGDLATAEMAQKTMAAKKSKDDVDSSIDAASDNNNNNEQQDEEDNNAEVDANEMTKQQQRKEDEQQQQHTLMTFDPQKCSIYGNEPLHALMDRICELCHDMYSHQHPNMRAECRSDCFRTSNFKRCLRLFRPMASPIRRNNRALRHMVDAMDELAAAF